MFEFEKNEPGVKPELVKPKSRLNYATGITNRSLLLWSEHCIECAAPECYQSCDLYTARPDERCRRFDYGTRRNNAFRHKGGTAAEIVFSRWGKLEARGNSWMLHTTIVKLVENSIDLLLPITNLVGRILRRFGADQSWASLSFELLDIASKRLSRRENNGKRPDGFLIEIYNPSDIPCKLKFSCSVSQSYRRSGKNVAAIPLPYWEQLTLNPGYNRRMIEYTFLSPVTESRLPYNLSFTPEAESGTHLVFITLDFVNIKDPNIARSRPSAKCVVFDLDNTLWDGVLLEGEVTLKPGIVQLLQELDKRGILMSIASKNNHQEVTTKLRELDILDYFILPSINWTPKSENLKLLIGKLNIGADTIVFVDDNPFEREEVLKAIPEIEVLPDTVLQNLLEHKRLQGSNTAESGNRRVMYQQQIERETVADQFGTDYLAFLRDCDIEVSISPYASAYRQRTIELLQRTNQLNFSGTKYTRDQITEFLLDDNIDKHVIHCKDKYGDYGLVGFSLTRIDSDTVVIQDFMLSCRVQGKLIEKAFFNYLAAKYLNNTGTLAVEFTATERNTPARLVLESIGFNIVTDGLSTLSVEPGVLEVDFLEINSRPATALKKVIPIIETSE